MLEAEKRDEFEFQLLERLPWQSVPKEPRPDDLQADREAFEALNQIETY